MKWLIRQLLWCTLIASIAPLLVAIFARGHASAHRLVWTFASSLTFALCIAVPLEYVLHRLVPKLRPYSRWITVPVYALVLAAFAVAGTLTGAVILCAIGLVPWPAYWSMFRDAVQVSLLLTGLFGVGGLMSGMLEHRLDEANKLLREKEEAARRARAMATEARLESLESRVHPHFLFNAINSILTLIREDPRRAEDLLERMAALLRFSLDSTHGRLVPLARELAIVRDYLEIERARFGDRLRFEVAAPVVDAEVPPLSIQTLVENSVKYAVSARREGGRIAVRVTPSGGEASIEIEDDGPGFGESDLTPGHGLDLLRERLAGAGALEFERREGGMIVRLRVPARVMA